MPTSVTMPALGESVTEGTVTRWLKQEGEQVEADEPLLEGSTDKGGAEIPPPPPGVAPPNPPPAAGVLTRILVAEDETVEVGAELAVIGGDGAEAPQGGGAQTQDAPPAEEQPQAQQPQAQPPQAQRPQAQQAQAEEAPQPQQAPASSDAPSSGG